MLGQVVPLASPHLARKPVLADGERATATGLSWSRGRCRPYGATVQADGVNFALFSRHAHAVQLLLFEESADEPFADIHLDPHKNKTGDIWHVLVHQLRPGVLYGYRVNGPFAPRQGHRYNPRTILLDPYARAVSGPYPWGATGPSRARPARLAKVVGEEFDWEDDAPPGVLPAQTVIYEMHVRGFTRHPSSGVAHPGTYAGLCEKIGYLKALGVTTIQLMPIAEFDEGDGSRRHPMTGEALLNYWGYSPLAFLAPKGTYASRNGQQTRELKELVKLCHKSGLEVILDVVYNHTSEGNENGPMLSYRGLDNMIYYALDKEGRYHNYTGCGNTVNCNHPVARDLILDCLMEWVSEYHIDGFRFDLAAIMARGPGGKPLEEPTLIQEIAEHPMLANVKLIAEAWDAAGLTMLGKFASFGRWAELNGHFRDDVRRFVRGEAGATMGLAKRITGSLDLYGTMKQPYHSINFVTCHDGFTLHDLVSYSKKLNEANGENNKDGWDDNLSFNCGVDGATTDAGVLAMRQRQMRNFLVLLFLSQGIPLLLMGDEMARTQRGNNNAYCQDNELSWLDWSLTRENAGLMRFTAMLIALRKKYFSRNREDFLTSATWHGQAVDDPDWTGQSRVLALLLRGGPGVPHFYFLFNAHWENQRFALPSVDGHYRWRRLVDTNLPSPDDVVEEKNAVPLLPGTHYFATARSTVVLMA